MKKNIIILILMLSALLLSACGDEDKTDGTEGSVNSTIVFSFGDIDVGKGEVYIYANTVKEKYESEYSKDVWDKEIDIDSGKTMEELTKEAVIAEIVRVKTFAAHAEEYDVRLSDTDEQEIRDKAHKFYEGLTDRDIEDMELTEELAYTVMKENMLLTRVREALLLKEPVEISDEQARMTCFYDMYFPCYTVNSAGYVRPYSEEKREEQEQLAIEACSKLATAGLENDSDAVNIEELAKSYGLNESKKQTLSPDEILDIYGQEIQDAIYQMKDGQYSTVLESEYGYHVFEMIEITAEKATAEKKKAMTETAVKSFITDKEIEWRNAIDEKFIYPDSVDMDLYNEIM